jgi:hypothetical protein
MSSFDDPEFKAWLASVEREMLPKMKDSAVSLAIFSGTIDAKICVEIGAAILLDKPIILLVPNDKLLPAALARAATKIVRGDLTDPDTQRRLTNALQEVL